MNNPPLSGPHTAANDTQAESYVEVIVNRVQANFFSGLVGQGCWPVSARAVAEIAGSGTASCSFCSLNRSDKNHTLLLQNGATLRVDGDIYTNSINGGTGPGCTTKKWNVCGDAFDIFGDPATPPAFISAKSIAVSGGWETHDENVVMADETTWPDYSTSPPTFTRVPERASTRTRRRRHRPPTSASIARRSRTRWTTRRSRRTRSPAPVPGDYAVPTIANCPTGTQFPTGTAGLTISTNATICPGRYAGGLTITAGTTTMLPGVYYMAGKGFHVAGTASIDGSSGVMIYSSTSGIANPVNIAPNPDLAAPIVDGRLTPGSRSRPIRTRTRSAAEASSTR